MADAAKTVTGQEIDEILDEIEQKGEQEQQLGLHIPDLPLVIIFVTGNKSKFNELQSFFGDEIMKYMTNYDIDLPEVQATEKEIVERKLFEANLVVSERIGLDQIKDKQIYIMVEDASFYLGMYSKRGFNFPGPFCKFAWKANGCQAFIDMVKYHKDKSCTALVTFGLMRIDEDGSNKYEPVYFQGECKGTVADAARGNNGFSWDQIFEYGDGGKTLAEMGTDEKNKISHRGEALNKIKQYIEKQLIPKVN